MCAGRKTFPGLMACRVDSLGSASPSGPAPPHAGSGGRSPPRHAWNLSAKSPSASTTKGEPSGSPFVQGSYGWVVKLQMSVSPKPTGQSSTGFGASSSAPSTPSCKSIRHSLIAGQTVALRASFHTVTP
jgi:hypothetical protein